MHDANPDGMFEVSRTDAEKWNRDGNGIFWTVNEFDGRRRIANLVRIRAWAIDMDDGTKDEQFAKLHASPLIPSLIVETKSGYHAYWYADDGKAKHWNAIVLDRLVHHFGADKRARDIARVLRVPGYYHLKNPADPFLIRTAWKADVSYTEARMAATFDPVERVKEERKEYRQQTAPERRIDGDDFWERVYNIDCIDGLERLSGHWAVGGEQYELKRNGSGTHNIWVDGKSTSCWIDLERRIGSLDEGGPTLYNWLRWFKLAPRDCAKVLKEIFPELEDRT